MSSPLAAEIETRLFINGEVSQEWTSMKCGTHTFVQSLHRLTFPLDQQFRAASDGATFPLKNPATLEQVALGRFSHTSPTNTNNHPSF
jgi:hypothetical protein